MDLNDYKLVTHPFKYEIGLSKLGDDEPIFIEGDEPYQCKRMRSMDHYVVDEEYFHDRDLMFVHTMLSHATTDITRNIHVVPSFLYLISLSIDEDILFIDKKTGKFVLGMVSLPTGWDPKEAIGKDFTEIHNIVPATDHIKKNTPAILKMIENIKFPMKRHTWGINHKSLFNGDDGIYFFTERQIMSPTDNPDIMMFTIRYDEIEFNDIPVEMINKICWSLKSMSKEVADYKGIDREKVYNWVKSKYRGTVCDYADFFYSPYVPLKMD